MYLVGLHIYYKMIHGPYNIKLAKYLPIYTTLYGRIYGSSSFVFVIVVHNDTLSRKVRNNKSCCVRDGGVW